jgi:glyoxylase-like metal-dependent hydrolase (beta-lactamase superfamily II)
MKMLKRGFWAVFFAPLFSVSAFAQTPDFAPEPDFEIRELGEGVYAAIASPSGRAVSNSGFIVNDSDVVVIDCHISPEIARSLLAEIRTLTDKPVRYLALTHRHRDHVGGTTAFGPEVEIISHENTRETMLSDTALLRQVKTPTLTFDSKLVFYRPSRIIELYYLGRGHTNGDIVAWLPAERVLFTGDLYFNGSAGYLGDGFFRDWVANLEKLRAFPAELIVPGHGPVSDSSGLLAFQNYLSAFIRAVQGYVEAGKSIEETLKEFSLPQYEKLRGWDGFLARNLVRCYNELKAEKQ